MKDKLMVYRGATLRSRFGGYGKIVEDSVIGGSRYIRKNTVFNVVSINLWTQSILAVNIATKDTLSLDYDYILENCEVIGNPVNTVIDGVAIIDTTKETQGVNWLKVLSILTLLNFIGICVILLALNIH